MSDPLPQPDPETVSLQGSYRIGFLPPAEGSLAAGEIYVQVPADGAAPVMFVGGLEGAVVSMVTGTLPAAAAASRKPDDPKTEPPKDDKRK